MRKEVTILIPTMFDSRYIIELCLQSIRKNTKYPYKVIVGNNGVDKETYEFLDQQRDIYLTDVTKERWPKDLLAEMVHTYYYLFLHDDTQILKTGWLDNRVRAMEKDKMNAIVGEIAPDFGAKSKLYLLNKKHIRFFPLGLLVKTEAAKELCLKWKVVKDKHDTGGYAYQQFIAQKKWKFVRYPMRYDIRHFGQMSWPIKKNMNKETTPLDLNALIQERKNKINAIRNILERNRY